MADNTENVLAQRLREANRNVKEGESEEIIDALEIWEAAAMDYENRADW